ncbi:MAG TPA: hypothetical protein VGO93_12235 [Candidatus Xenobia bacterium]
MTDHRPHPLLLAWVPQPWVEGVAKAIRVNPESCIYWIEETDLAWQTYFDLPTR